MALFVHLTPEKNVRGIVRSGIKKGANGVFCLPILPSYVISHQWLRELRRGTNQHPSLTTAVGGYREVSVNRLSSGGITRSDDRQDQPPSPEMSDPAATAAA
ncbi:hypothetical protein [Kibdelosporangium aridum]|uniref:Uncharacterized protein n=1 Tax=Kibdelosporangium aridum TaxID=2030 RepID=A0A1Y5XM82_KIBAR|nr:hypothetical protein [Kibdelosporangium aridum]SMD06065.1 hypothetical protein SAMN05661093_04040 [Kibdelosporangium aridum]